MNRYTRVLAVVALLVLAGPLAAADRTLGAEWKPIDTARLDGMRGGFVVPSGFVVSFGIERVVSVNGEVVSSTQSLSLRRWVPSCWKPLNTGINLTVIKSFQQHLSC